MDDLFFKLTPDRVLEAVEQAGLEPTGHLMPLHCLENRVFDLRLEDNSHVVAKFYRPGRWSLAAIQEEHDFLFDLLEAEVPVCAPLKFSDGQSIHQKEGIFFALWPRTGGRSPEELDDKQVETLGRLVARIHSVGALRPSVSRRPLNADTYARESLAFLREKNFLPPRLEKRYAAAVEKVAQLYEARIKGVPQQRIHGDCHYGNLLNGREGWFFLDFDDFAMGPPVQDVWMLVPGRDAEGERQRELFIEAYRSFRKFETRWLSLVEPLRALRYIHYAAWIARRWHDPAFPQTFTHFNTERYWEQETIDLEEQLERC